MTSLRILVPIKRVLDYALKPRIAASGKAIDLSGQKLSINPFDELSIEASVRLREAHPTRVGDILAFSAGPAKSQESLRTAMAMGADRGLLVDTSDADLEPLAVAKVLRAVVEKEGCNLVVLGKQSIDDDAGQTGQMLAGLLGWPQATQAAEISLDGDALTVVKEIDGGTETVRGNLPMVVTTDLRLNEPRYASLPNIMKAKKKELNKVALKDYGDGLDPRLEVLQVVEPPPRQGGGKVEDVAGLVAKLKELGAMLGGVEAVLDLDGMRRDLGELREQAADPELWNDQDRAQQVTRRLSYLEGELGKVEGLRNRLDDAALMLELASEEGDEDTRAEVERELATLRKEIEQVEKGEQPKDGNVLKMAPHTMKDLVREDWDRPYSRSTAAYPLPWLKEKKFWPAVTRLDDSYGDLNLFCSCAPVKTED